jgi:hypothetical protein
MKAVLYMVAPVITTGNAAQVSSEYNDTLVLFLFWHVSSTNASFISSCFVRSFYDFFQTRVLEKCVSRLWRRICTLQELIGVIQW